MGADDRTGPGSERETSPYRLLGKGSLSQKYSGDVLLSQGAAPQVPSALTGLTSVFGMGTGISPSLRPPETFESLKASRP